ncbi:MAG: hypothetical protein ACLT0R_01745 [Paraclostridium sordellii]
MAKEIGSEFSYSLSNIMKIINSSNNSLNKFLNVDKDYILYLNTGRSAIKYLIDNIISKKYKKILVPSYLCSSILKSIESSNIDIEFYRVTSKLEIDLDDIKSKIDNSTCIFIINFFGFEQRKEIRNFLNEVRKSNVIIEDCTHSILSRINPIGHYQIASMRKWIGIPDGSIIISLEHKIHRVIDLIYDEFILKRLIGQLAKNEYLVGGNIEKDKFLNLISDAEQEYDENFKISKISDISKKILNNQDYSEIIKIRRTNYLYLLKNSEDINSIEVMYKEISNNVCPLGFVVITNQRDRLRQYLAKNRIYCPIHWSLPKILSNKYEESIKLSENILTIPCDQRYTIDDMKYIIKKLRDYKRCANE